jgi:hypothetical protein
MLQHQYFYATPALFMAKKPGRDNPSVIHHQEIPRQEQPGEIEKPAVRERTAQTIHDKQPGMIPFGGRRLCDEILRQVVIVVFYIKHSRTSNRLQ